MSTSGKIDQVKGRVKKAVGDLTGDAALRREGVVDETTGKIKDAVDKGVDAVRDKLKKA
jgi:uncharacterized protein YjbJ (UPF0337 family)